MSHVAGSIDGIVSGLNTTELIDSIIQSQRSNAFLLEFQVENKTNEVSTLKALQAKFLALSTQIANLKRVSTFEASSVKVSDDTILTATSTGRLGSGSYSLQVLELARNHQLASQGISDDSVASLGTGTISIQVGDGTSATVTIDSTNNSLTAIKSAINDAGLGVTASIINDGSSENPYRLLLTSNKTGLQSKITISSSLTGGTNLDFTNSSFDVPETISFASGSDSIVTLGGTASYSGSENKFYTFTVQGTGEQTVGTDTINIDWTDGTNSGTITVSTAAAEVTLTGTGSDGLKISFSAGKLNAGDTFQVQTFAPLLQEGSDAKIALGSSGGSGSAITVTSSSNTFKDVLAGLEFTVFEKTSAGSSVTITTSINTSAIRNSITEFIKRYNEINDFIDDQNSFNQDTGVSGTLFGDLTVQTVQNTLRRTLGARIKGIDTNFNQLFSIGIRTLGAGVLAIADSSRFNDALENNLDDVITLFTDGASSSSSFVTFFSAQPETVTGESFEVDITQAATHGRFQGAVITDPASTPIVINSSNSRLKIKVNKLESNEIILTQATYDTTAELINELKEKIQADAKIGKQGVEVEWVSTGGSTGYVQITSSSYGTNSKIEIVASQSNSAHGILGLTGGTVYAGVDVEGTINGETAEGLGQFLTGKEGNLKTDGLKLLIDLDSTQLIAGAEAIVTVTRGIASQLDEFIDSVIAVGEGTFDRRIRATENQIADLNKRIGEIDERLALRRQSLIEQFIELETSLGRLQGVGQFLTTQLNSLNANWILGRSRN
ncbi:MAG: flagellar filament capping protein FliD [candidate division Zixibacteria bacterium]|nr:flagellar filament capping protein FliD [candidate division Zixibacteria bacterium]